jgi:histidinol dehydrogenase
MALLVFDLATPTGRAMLAEKLDDLRASASGAGDAGQTVAGILADVKARGDAGVVDYMRKWTDPAFSVGRIKVSMDEIKAAVYRLEMEQPLLRRAIDRSIENVTKYQTHILPQAGKPVEIDGAKLGMRFTPVSSVGLAVPGGRASYPSSVIMLAVPAMVAGVPRENIRLVTPPPTTRDGEEPGDVSYVVLATCGLLGIEEVYRVGGAQAMAALAYGTDTIKPVDMIVGPGNIFVQLAKQQLAGRVGIDGFYGPSEIVTIADEDARPDRVASDLIAQAEHDPGRCFLISWSAKVIESVNREVSRQSQLRYRQDAIRQSFEKWSCAILVKDVQEAAKVADELAGEHVNLAVKQPEALLGLLKNGGEFFLGDATPVAAGDYHAGPSHCLPTGTTARFASGISVYTFLKRSGTVQYPGAMPKDVVESIATFAQAEGLDGHAASAQTRLK